MPYLILVIGILIGLYALYRFFLKASVKQIKAMFLSVLLAVLCIALFYMAVTGRLPAAIALLVAIVPVIAGIYKNAKTSPAQTTSQEMTRKDALDILGLNDDADETLIKDAYKKLMKKVHPDQDGSEWMAEKLNKAKDFLLDESSKT